MNVIVCAFVQACMCGFMPMCEWLFVYVGVCVGSDGEAACSPQKSREQEEALRRLVCVQNQLIVHRIAA